MIRVVCYVSTLLVVLNLVSLQYSPENYRDKRNTTVVIGVFLSNDIEGECIKASVLMAQDRINGENLLFLNDTVFQVTASFMNLSEDKYSSLLEINSFVDDLPIQYSPVYFLGSPRNRQNKWISNMAMGRSGLFAIPVVTYSGKRESMKFDFTAEVSPTIFQMFDASIRLLQEFNWSRVSVIHDASFDEYKSSHGYLVSSLRTANVTILSTVVLYSQQNFIQQEMDQLEASDSRIIFGLFSLRAARKVFCEAIKRRMLRNDAVLWILYERLPKGWAGSKYDPPSPEGREIPCSERELLEESSGYIFIEKSSMFDKLEESSLDKLNRYLREVSGDVEADASISCPPDTLYAHDSMLFVTALYKDFLRDIEREVFISMQKSIKITKISEQGLTGSVHYSSPNEPSIYTRSTGVLKLYKTNERDSTKTEKLFGTYVFQNLERNLSLSMDAVDTLFGGREILNDSPLVEIEYKTFSPSTLRTMWGLAFGGLVFALTLFVYAMRVYIDRITMVTDLTLFLGAVFCYASVIIYGLDPGFVDIYDIGITCRAFIVTFTLGSSLFLVSILVRVWRMYRLAFPTEEREKNEDDDERKPDRESEVDGGHWSTTIILLVVLLGDALLLLVWFLHSDIYTFSEDVSRKPLPVYQSLIITKTHLIRCNCPNIFIYTITLCLYKILILVITAFLSLEVHSSCGDKPLTINGEVGGNCKNLGMAACNMLVAFIVASGCSYILHSAGEYDSVYIILAVCIIVSVTTSLLLVFFSQIQRGLCGNSTVKPKNNPCVYKPKKKDITRKDMTTMT